MATSISDLTGGLVSKPLVEYDWWKHHMAFLVAVFFVVPMILTFYAGFSPVWDYFGVEWIVRFAVNWLLRLIAVLVVVAWVGSLIGYYFDARYLESVDADWSPHWMLYTAVHVIPVVGAFIAVPIYVLQRMRHVGLPIFT
ncbi:hypothetical protein [Halapricum salinum]|uniref:Uncharacterized protein n=1 Tax=Halapricum salinum TaxID=1457250 RepID=A0A4D6HF66_9EURY|nr:hypothetical protein [Halapricum salinum]QCC52694.1 hypothetical protein DV733_16285 [Halapricum salinum]